MSIDGLVIYGLKLRLWAVSSSEEAAQRQFDKLCELGKALGVERVLEAAVEMQAAGFSEKEARDAIKTFLATWRLDIAQAQNAFPRFVAAIVNVYRYRSLMFPNSPEVMKCLKDLSKG